MKRIIPSTIILILLCVSIFSCSQNKQVQAQFTSITKIGSISLDFPIKDLAYETNRNMLYVAEDFKDFIWIYNNFDFQNKIGGKGNSNSSFQLLSDIEVSDNGNLLVLDRLQKRIQIFDKDGVYLSSLSLQNYHNPSNFTLGSDDLVYIYDRDEQEVILLNLLTKQEFIRFGKFEIDLPQAIRFANDKIFVTNSNFGTDIYSSLGSFVDNFQQLAIKDRMNNKIILHNNFIFVNGKAEAAWLFDSNPKGIFLKSDKLIIFSQNEIAIYRLNYTK